MAQSVPCRRLDGDRAPCHHRRRGAFRQRGGAACSQELEGSMTAMQASPVAESRSAEGLSGPISRAAEALLALQKPDGHFVFEPEADATIPAEYVLMRHYRAEPVA